MKSSFEVGETKMAKEKKDIYFSSVGDGEQRAKGYRVHLHCEKAHNGR